MHRSFSRSLSPRLFGLCVTLLALSLGGCGQDDTAAGPDAAADVAPEDTATADTATTDTGAPDTGAPDTGSPDVGSDILGRNPPCDGPADCGAPTGPCRAWYCDSKLGCVESVLPDAALCDDDDPCHLGSACSGGSCVGGAAKDCDDGDPCTADGCAEGACNHAALPEGASVTCDDGDACTALDLCEGGVCKGSQSVCLCQTDADCSDKNGGNLCLGSWYCAPLQGGGKACQLNPATVVVCDPSADTPCQKNVCDPAKGQCNLDVFGEGKACEDGVACTEGEVCKGGKCEGGTNVCCTNDVDCAGKEDGDACNGTLFCNLGSGKCQLNPLTIVSCPTVGDTACSKATCDPKDGSCKPVAITDGALCDDGNPCTPGEACKGGVCTATETNTCPCKADADCADKDDGDPCNGTPYCDAKDGTCKTNPATVVVCNSTDDTACSKNTCDPKDGACKQTPVFEGTPCNADGNPCTPNDACKSGTCEADPLNTCVCSTNADCAEHDDGDLCNGSLYCEKTGAPGGKGLCKVNAATVVSCPSVDNTACSQSLCQPKTGKCAMTFVHQGEICDDGDPCSKGDVCDNGTCKSGGDICLCKKDSDCLPQEDGDACNGTLYCAKDALPWSCQVKPSTVITCPTVNDSYCQQSICQPLTGLCKLLPLHVDEPCDDGDTCTVNTVCKGGLCVDPLADSGGKCNDGNPCTTDSCDKILGCLYTANTAPCDDGNPCTEGDACLAKACKSGKPKVCDDGNACTTDLCNQQSGCVSFGNSNPCNDADACTIGDLCQGGQCVPGATKACKDNNPCSADSCDSKTGNCVFDDKVSAAVLCDDGVGCTLDTCDKITGCAHVPADGACDDKVACTTDACSPLAGCVHLGDDASCDDNDACTTDSCIGGVGCKHVAVADGAPCVDGDACTIGDSCKAGKCTAGAAVPACSNDPNQCKGKPDGTACNDGDACSKGETCAGGVCRALPTLLEAETIVRFKGDDAIDGPAALAYLRWPHAVALAPSGDIYFAGTIEGSIRAVSPAGEVRTLAGTKLQSPNQVSTDAKLGAALIGDVHDIDVAPDGTAYFVEPESHLVRKLLPSREVVTVAGSTAGAVDGKGGAAKFDKPVGVAVMPDGWLAIGEWNNRVVRKVAVDGTVTLLAGAFGQQGGTDGKGTAARFRRPAGLDVAPDGALIVADTEGPTIRRVTADGTVTTLAGVFTKVAVTDGPKATALLSQPVDVAVAPSGEIYFLEGNPSLLRRVALDGAVTTLLGSAGKGHVDGPAAQAKLNIPMRMTFDAFGDLVIADHYSQSLRRIRLRHDSCDDGKICTRDSCDSKTGSCTVTPTNCSDGSPCTKDLCDDKTGACSWKAEPDGAPCDDGDVCTSTDRCAGGFCHAAGLLQKASPGGVGGVDGPLEIAKFDHPAGLRRAADGRIAITENGAHRIRMLGTDGVVRTLAGATVSWGYVDGPPDVARFNNPVGVDFAPDGGLFIADAANHRVRHVAMDGTVSTYAGGDKGTVDGPVATARFDQPHDVRLDAKGGLLVADRYNHRIRHIAGGVVTTLAGAGSGFRDGPAEQAQFHEPIGLDVGPDGSVYVADFYNRALRKITPGGLVLTVIGADVGMLREGVGRAANLPAIFSVAVRPDGGFWLNSLTGHVALVDSDGRMRLVSGAGSGSEGLSSNWEPQQLGRIIAMPDGGALYTLHKLHTLVRLQPPVPSCDDANACTADACAPKIGCQHVATANVCEDGDPCTSGDACAAGACKPGAKVAGCVCKAIAGYGCDDGNPCTAESCDPKTGCSFTARDGEGCDDGDACTTGERCRGKTCLANPDLRAVRPAGGAETSVAQGQRDGPIIAATGPGVAVLRTPTGIAANDQGEVAIADTYNHTIRVLRKDGRIDTIAGGNGQRNGKRDGGPTVAEFWEPYDVAPSLQGGWYVADRLNHTIRLIAADGSVTTIAGSAGQKALLDGKGASARFGAPQGIGADGTGGVLVADTDNHSIRKVSADGTVTTIAGTGSSGQLDGPGTVATFYYPLDVASGKDGIRWVVEGPGRRLRRIDAKGEVSTALHDAGNAAPLSGVGQLGVNLGALAGVAVGADGVYFSDYDLGNVRRYDPLTQRTVVIAGGGKAQVGVGTEVALPNARGVAVLPNGEVVVTLPGKHRLRRLVPIGKGCDDGDACTLDSCDPKAGCKHGAGALEVLCPDGGPCLQPSCASEDGYCRYAARPEGTLCGDKTDCSLQCVRGTCSSVGVLEAAIGTGSYARIDGGPGKAQFAQPADVVGDGKGKLYVAEWGSASIRVVDADGNVTTLAGGAGTGYAEGKGAAAKFNGPTSIDIDGPFLYVADYYNNRIRKVDLEGNVITIAGNGAMGHADGPGLSAMLKRPAGVAAKGGVVWVTDTDNHVIRRVEGGKVSTIAGKVGTSGARDGPFGDNGTCSPADPEVDAKGRVYFADIGGHSVRRLEPSGLLLTVAGDSGPSMNGQVEGIGVRGGGFGEVRHIAVLADGSILATEHSWHEIRRAWPGDKFTSVVGVGAKPGFADGAGPAAMLHRHAGLGHDGAGGIWVADFFHNRVRRLRLDLESCGDLLGTSPQNAAPSCAAWQAASKVEDADQVFIDPDPKDEQAAFATQCNVGIDGGGWTRIPYDADEAEINKLLGGKGQLLFTCSVDATDGVISPVFEGAFSWSKKLPLAGTWTINGKPQSCSVAGAFGDLACGYGVGCYEADGKSVFVPGQTAANQCAAPGGVWSKGAFSICGKDNHTDWQIWVRNVK